MTKWTSVKDGLPKNKGYYQVVIKATPAKIYTRYFALSVFWRKRSNAEFVLRTLKRMASEDAATRAAYEERRRAAITPELEYKNLTHWAELPELPGVDKINQC